MSEDANQANSGDIQLGTVVFIEILIFIVAAFVLVAAPEKGLMFLVISHTIFLPIAGRYLT